jgi:hypothetical protein
MADVDIVSAAVKRSEERESEEGGSSDCISHIVALHCSALVSGVLNIMALQVQAKFRLS